MKKNLEFLLACWTYIKFVNDDPITAKIVRLALKNELGTASKVRTKNLINRI